MNDEDRLMMLLGSAQYYREKFTPAEIEESELLRESRTLSEDDQRILRESEETEYVQGLTPRMMKKLGHNTLSRGSEFIEKYPEMALNQNMRLFSTVPVQSHNHYGPREERTPFFTEEDIVALDEAAKSRGAPVHQFVHCLVSLKPSKKNKLMFSRAFSAAVKSSQTFDELAKANSLDIRWIPGLEGYRFDKCSYSSQLWLGRKNMIKYRKVLLKKVLELLKKLSFEESFEVALKFARYALPRDVRRSYYPSCNEGFKDLARHMFMHFGGRQDLIDMIFKACLAKGTFEECLTTYNQIHNGRVSAFAIVHMEKLAKTADHHWTIAQIAFRRKNTKLWKRHLKKAAAKA